jgi:membrane-associated protease RseP (regulator of RpoE activity)
MQDKTAQNTLKVPRMLKEAGIPYAMVTVPWPFPSIREMIDNLSRIAACAEKNAANIIQINLPGFTRRLPEDKRFDPDEVWSAVVEKVRDLRKKLDTPVVMMPSLYEETLFGGLKNTPEIIGLVKNSPAKRAGLEKQDLILSINGIPVQNRPQARDLLSLIRESHAGETTITVKRKEQQLSLKLDLYSGNYPYAKDWDNHLGMVFTGTGLRLEYLERLRDIIAHHKAKKVLFLSSRLVRPLFEQLMKGSLLLADREVRIDIEVPDNNFFGGNVCMGDLLVVQDYIDWINQYLAAGKARPDLIVIPSSPFSLGQWKRDLTGRVYLDIERAVDIPVALMECMTICD